jgi:hypothetical protein
MAMAPSPEMSPVMGSSHRIDRNRSQSPPAQALSKRDKKRTQLLERLQEVTLNFSSNKDAHYRHQLQAIQVDTSLIFRADLYSDRPLDDRDGDLREMVNKAQSIYPNGLAALNKGEMTQIAGNLYSAFAEEVVDAVEARDAALTRHRVSLLSSFSLETTKLC